MNKSDEEQVILMDKYIEEILISEPPQGWHCPNVGNFSQVSNAEDRMSDYFENQNNRRIAYQMAKLIRLIERYDRELNVMDYKLNDWLATERATALGLNVLHLSDNIASGSYYSCPHCKERIEVNPSEERDFK